MHYSVQITQDNWTSGGTNDYNDVVVSMVFHSISINEKIFQCVLYREATIKFFFFDYGCE